MDSEGAGGVPPAAGFRYDRRQPHLARTNDPMERAPWLQELCSNGTKGTARKRERVLLSTGLLMASWVFAGPLARAEVLYQKDGVQLRGTARIITYDAAVCRVREENHTEAEYEAIKGNDGQPLHVWQLDYSAHNGTGKALSYLRADFEIESEHPPCTNWTGEGPGGGVAGGRTRISCFGVATPRPCRRPPGCIRGRRCRGSCTWPCFTRTGPRSSVGRLTSPSVSRTRRPPLETREPHPRPPGLLGSRRLHPGVRALPLPANFPRR